MSDATGFDLGPLEADVMRLVWEKGEVQVDDVHQALLADREIAYTTVMTVMTRLTRKGLLTRRKHGRAYLYRAARRREEMAESTLHEWSQRFFGGRVLPAVSFLLGRDRLTPDEIAELRRLLERLEEGEER
ncbi:putative transcriptional regulator [Symbiobacterium terraclitae]|uniref:Transcriptional regulator n=1 Tax=Symbiobacterium terraclitae TaxID=557451 RepID=A0ABS4JZF1_9FIRM|nr:BlaI/MecI/CopY family transcriptional regulator [Symbiobacterium terraclitae]MBP2019819.1 putative transcriptional regulator [Symbiobacterium terraclitae]